MHAALLLRDLKSKLLGLESLCKEESMRGAVLFTPRQDYLPILVGFKVIRNLFLISRALFLYCSYSAHLPERMSQ